MTTCWTLSPPTPPDMSPVRSLRALLLSLMLLPLAAQGQPQTERWYRVELLVFAQPGGAGAEQWPATPAPRYPPAARFLIDPARVAANTAEYGIRGEIDEFGRQIITLPRAGEPLPPNSDGLRTEGAAVEDAGSDIPERLAAPPAISSGETPPNGENLQSPAPARPRPFVTLPAGELEYRGKAAYMARNGGYRILFHEAWLQPMGEQAQELPIILDHSGDGGSWPELQGSILLYLARYLHLETNLWLNTQGQYFPDRWQMPPPPLSPPSLIVEEPEPLPADDSAVAAASPALSRSAARDPALAPPPQSGAPDAVNGESPADAEETGPVYPFRHAVTLRQTRRMRSDELHYLDHPMFGLVIKLTPLSEEELAALAARESGNTATPSD